MRETDVKGEKWRRHEREIKRDGLEEKKSISNWCSEIERKAEEGRTEATTKGNGNKWKIKT